MWGFVPWLIRWSERQPLNREEGMATNHGITLNTQPWGNTHADIRSNTHTDTHRNRQWTIGDIRMWYTLLRIGIKHTLWCDVESPAGVQPQQHHTNMASSLFLRNNYWRLFSHIEGEKSQYADWYSVALTQIVFSHAVWKSVVQFTLASGKVSLKNVGSHDSSVKKVLAVHKCVIITALKFRQERLECIRNQCHQHSLSDIRHCRCIRSFSPHSFPPFLYKYIVV